MSAAMDSLQKMQFGRRWNRGVWMLVLAVTMVCNVIDVFGESNLERIADLLHLQSQSKDGVIRLDDNSFRRFGSFSSEPRPYSLILFFDAQQLWGNSELKLEELRREYGLAASAYVKMDGKSGKVFFCDLEFKHSQGSFQAFGVKTLPQIKHLPSGQGDLSSAEELEQGEHQRTAEGMAAFVTLKAKVTMPPIERPPAISKVQVVILAFAFIAAAPFAIRKLLSKDTPFHDPKLWCVGSLLIYFFSVSGGMHNIIRKMPFYMHDRKNPGKIIFFYHGSGMQLGAEGYVVGFLYSVVGILLAFVTQILPDVKSKSMQRVLMLIIMAIGFTAVRQVIYLDNWKTGYWVHGYWPNRWR